MPYCNPDDIKQQVTEATLIEITDDNLAGEINAAVVNEAILYSATIIDGYLRGRYTLPLPTIPEIVKILAVDLSIFRLYLRRFHTDMPDSINDKYKNSIKLLEQIQKGIISLGIETAGTPPKCGEYRTNKTYRDREFPKIFLDTF
ncbi:MAG: mu-like protein prophage Flumu protein gp36 [Candidatus Peregrinibacteria bacterium GW2011_GWC2_33_13]|nr:MAG: mu-like protein prophage Flumu protein gp36 [Candidatus Peregrinibacteria bacterium GW2011_GWC2_33_13]